MNHECSLMKLSYCLIFFLFLGIPGTVQAQEISLGPEARISVLSCGPGEDLYASFGHSAFRVQDPAQHIDWVFNYGTFDFDTPNFYLKFARGKLLYALSLQRFENFLYTYQLENRWVREQILDLDSEQRNSLFRFLQENHRPENRYYKYDFLFENCATKIPEVLKTVLGPELGYEYTFAKTDRSFRDLIQMNLRRNSWSSFGIDLALGSVIDRQARPEEFIFLPEFVYSQMKEAGLNGKPLVQRERLILDFNNQNVDTYFTVTPLFWMLILLLFTMAFTLIDYRNDTRNRWFDFLLFSTSGLCGLVIAFLWFFTDHTSTQWNANILWAFPLNLLLASVLIQKSPTSKYLMPYLWLLLAFLVIAVVLWISGVQEFTPIIGVLWGCLILRYVFLICHFNPRL